MNVSTNEDVVPVSDVGTKITILVVIGTDCIGSYKSTYHTNRTTMVPFFFSFFYYILTVISNILF
jgi:hypothetical protein